MLTNEQVESIRRHEAERHGAACELQVSRYTGDVFVTQHCGRCAEHAADPAANAGEEPLLGPTMKFDPPPIAARDARQAAENYGGQADGGGAGADEKPLAPPVMKFEK